MSSNKVNKTTGELVTLANGMRCWIGTKAAHDAAVQAGTMPNNCLVAIVDDWQDATVDVVEDGNMHPVTSNAVYDTLSKHIFGTAVDISGYTGTNSYLVPADGYSYIINTTGETRLYALNADKSTGIAIGANKSITSLYVKKGMYLTLNTLSGTLTSAKFYPLE